MLTIREAQQRTGLSRITFQRNISNGTIRSIKQGNKFLVYEEDFHLLPKPRRTGVQQQARAETERSLQENPFLAPPMTGEQRVEMENMTGEQRVEMEKWKAVQSKQKTIQMLIAS